MSETSLNDWKEWKNHRVTKDFVNKLIEMTMRKDKEIRFLMYQGDLHKSAIVAGESEGMNSVIELVSNL